MPNRNFSMIFALLRMLLAGCVAVQLAACATYPPETPGPLSAVDQAASVSGNEQSGRDTAERWGIEIEGLRLTSANYMLDLRYRILDPAKAGKVLNAKSKPYLIVEGNGSKLLVPNAAKVGPLQQTRGKLIPGRSYFMFFVNPGQMVKSGEQVTLVVGDMVAKHIKIN